ncbi:MAG TPA: M3 family oligoendopeptidase [Bdellovibrionota bacterium]|nr:M3 family oligoendopeptidase [Bdellovibrionota bacterium]
MNPEQVTGPAWNLESEYPGIETGPFRTDWNEAEKLVGELEALTARITIPPKDAPGSAWSAQVPHLQKACKIRQELELRSWNLARYLHMAISVDTSRADLRKQRSELQALESRCEQAWNPAELWIALAPADAAEAYLSDAKVGLERFVVERRRLLRDQKLGLPEENLVSALSVDGFDAWGTLYDNIAGSIRCTVQTPEGEQTFGAAAAQEFTASTQEPVRKSAYLALEAAWGVHRESCAAILNALAGWRLEMYRRRSHTRQVGFLDGALYSSRIERATLDTMMEAITTDGRAVGQRALKAMARAMGKKKIDCWDFMAPAPPLPGASAAKPIPFAQAVETVASCGDEVDPELGAFVRMAAEKQWIEGRVLPNKLPGAYCSKFIKSRTPRVYLTYQGTPSNVRTLAHELGHAYHNWVMRELPLSQAGYPMTLAETASILMETLVNDVLKRQSDAATSWAASWDDGANAAAFLLNIPSRFTFEREFYERRAKGELTVEEISEISERHFTEHYGQVMGQVPKAFWQTKLHFYISGVSFYNFPYSFGYLFALGVYAQRQKLGKGFAQAYRALLNDTGRMTAEDVAKKHLGADLTKPDFWRDSIRMAEERVQLLEEAVLRQPAGNA